jgi:photosystem II stability/assembly factor-like uncharacterized protein
MKKKIIILIFLILTVLFSSGIVYSQTTCWESTGEPDGYISSITVANNGDIWVGTLFRWDYNDNKTYLGTIYLSTDNGNTWVEKNNGITGKEGFSIHSITINPVNSYLFAVTMYSYPDFTLTYECFRSTDKGESWTKILDNQYFSLTLLVTPSGEMYMQTFGFTSDFHVYYSSDDGDTWIKKSNGLPENVRITSFAMGTDGALYAGLYGVGLYYTTNGGNEWLHLADISRFIRDITIVPDGSMFLSVDGLGVIKSTDKGVTWSQGRYGNVENIIYNPITTHLFVSGLETVVSRSSDLGASWHQLNNGLPDHYDRFRLAVNPKTGMMFVVVPSRNVGVYRSTPMINVDIAPESIDFGALQSGSYKDTVLYITNIGATDIVITDVNIIGDDSESFINTFNDAITIKRNETQKFSITFASNTGGTKIATMEIVTDIGNILISLNGNSIEQTISVNEPEEIPTTYSLMQNYPNPFNPTTIIQYSIPKDEFVKLTVYDITGKVVKELVSGHKVAGKYSVEFNASSYSSGIYYYRLEAGEYKNIKKMVLIK